MTYVNLLNFDPVLWSGAHIDELLQRATYAYDLLRRRGIEN